MRALRFSYHLSIAVAVVLLAGCATVTSVPEDTPLGAISGSVHGGRQPVQGAHIYLFAAGTSGNAGPGLSATTANASTSLLNSSVLVNNPANGGQDSIGYYVATDASGSFSLNGDYSCVAGTQVYVYSLGGNPGAGTTNAAAGFLAALGQCPSTGTMAAVTPYVNVNEVSTVAAAYAFAGYATDATHVSSDGSSQALTGIANAFANAAQMFAISGANAGRALTITPAGTGSVPQAEIHSIANALAACINSSGSSSTQCATNLFGSVKSGGATGSTGTDTATEAIYIAHNPGTAVSTVFNNAQGIGAPWQPTLSTAPSDFSIGISFSGVNQPLGIDIDASGDIWLANYGNNTVSELSSLGVPMSGSPFTGNGLNEPYGVAVDRSSANIWVSNFAHDQAGAGSLSEFSINGAAAQNSPFTEANMRGSAGLAVDLYGNIWVTNLGSNYVSYFLSDGVPGLVNGGFSNGDINSASTVAVDLTHHLWFANEGTGDNVSELNDATGSAVLTNGTTCCGLRSPTAIAIDGNNTWWATNTAPYSTLVHSTLSSALSGGGMNNPDAIAIDGDDNIWVGSYGSASIAEFSNSGTLLSPSNGFASSYLGASNGIAVDPSGDVWVPNNQGTNIVEFIGLATPTVTSISGAAYLGKIGKRP